MTRTRTLARRTGHALLPSVVPLLIGGSALLLAACAGGAPAEPPADHRERVAAFLLAPAEGWRIRQNDSTSGCPAHGTRGYGLRLRFDWQDVDGATAYAIHFKQRNARVPLIDRTVHQSAHEETHCNGFVADHNLEGWSWRVAALGPVSARGARDTLVWSEERDIGFEPCRLADGRACHAVP